MPAAATETPETTTDADVGLVLDQPDMTIDVERMAMSIDVSATIEAGAPVLTARKPIPPLIHRPPYIGRVRKHAACQSEQAETGELKLMRATAIDAQQQLAVMEERIEAAAVATNKLYAERLQERADSIQAQASNRLHHVEHRCESSIVRTRAAAGAFERLGGQPASAAVPTAAR